MTDSNLEELLKKCKIVGENEDYDAMTERVFSSIVEKEKNYNVSEEERLEFKERIKTRFNNKELVPSTTILTNAGRYLDKPLTACSVPPINLKDDLAKVKTSVDLYHQKGMGTGFNFDECDNPVELLTFLNDVALQGQKSGKEDRPVGNMGIISTDHPQIMDLIQFKSGDNKDKEWMFNLSVNVKKDFMDALGQGKSYVQRDGTEINPNDLMNAITEHAWACGDPGLTYLERFNQDNPAPQLGEYKSLAPCGEVAMTDGETCQFTYLNVGKFVKGNQIDYTALEEAVNDTVRFVDDALDVSIENYEDETSTNIMNQKRKIGIGMCGLADMLIKMDVAYESDQTETIVENLMSFINFTSKKASVELAKQRGAFPAFYDEGTRLGKGFIMERYGNNETETVSKEDWKNLSNDIRKYGIRNVSTTAIPPTGRSSLVIGASPAIEPYFSLNLNQDMRYDLVVKLEIMGVSSSEIIGIEEKTIEGSLTKEDLPESIRDLYKTCLEIDPVKQLGIIAGLQKYTDESISKTINLQEDATTEDVKNIYLQSYDMGLKGITIYRNNSRLYQPKEVKKQEKSEKIIVEVS